MVASCQFLPFRVWIPCFTNHSITEDLFEPRQYVQSAELFPPHFADFPCNTSRIPRSNRLRLAKTSLIAGHTARVQTRLSQEKTLITDIRRKYMEFLFDGAHPRRTGALVSAGLPLNLWTRQNTLGSCKMEVFCTRRSIDAPYCSSSKRIW